MWYPNFKAKYCSHKKNCSAGTLFCTQYPIFLTKNENDLDYHIAKKHSKATARVVHRRKICNTDFHSFYLLRGHKRKELGAQRSSEAQFVHVVQVMGDVDDSSSKEKLETCKHFLNDRELKNGRHRIQNFAMDILDPKYLLEKLDFVCDSLKCAAKSHVAFDFVQKNIEVRSSRYYYAHEKTTVFGEI